jgi:glycosyltransferase involved in cell wall biosynthesis
MSVIRVDYTHVGRRATGIERITTEQFGGSALAPLTIEPFFAHGNRLAIMAAQTIGLPINAARNTSDVFVFPGFPPSPLFTLARDRAVHYVHDMFLLTRRDDLNNAARYYMAPMFSIAIKRLRYFLTNSQDTARQLANYCDPEATVLPYRPRIRNVFELSSGDRALRPRRPGRLKVVSIGTIEPRKNFPAAAEICELLAARLHCEVDYEIIGRFGWGEDAELLRQRDDVTLHGALDDAEIRPIVEGADLFLCTSHAEGLGLPLLEAQYAGIPVIAPDAPIFREVLGTSGIFVNPRMPAHAADRIANAMAEDAWRARFVDLSTANIARWNANADTDRGNVVELLSRLSHAGNGNGYRQ